MSYIGTAPTIGNFQVCDAISVVNGQASYTMQVSSVNVVPQSANHMLVSLNGILQKPNSSFTVSGSTITFASNLVTGDVIDFIQILGSVLDLGVPSDNTVSLAKLTATGTKSSSTFLRGDNTFASAGGTTAPYVSVYRAGDQTISDATWTKIQFNTEIVDSAGAFDNSSNYRFTPQTAGYYFVNLNVGIGTTVDNSTDQVICEIQKNGSGATGGYANRNWDTVGLNYNDVINTSLMVQCNGSSDYIEGFIYIDVTSGTPRVESNSANMQIFKMTE